MTCFLNRVRLVNLPLAAVHPTCLAARAAYDFAGACVTTTLYHPLKSRKHRLGVAMMPAFRHALLSGQGSVARLRCRQMRPRARRLPGHHHACSSSWLPQRTSHDVPWQQHLRCICRGRGHVSANAVPQVVPDTNTSLTVMQPHAIPVAVSKAVDDPPNGLRNLAASHCPWVLLRSQSDSTPAWRGSPPCLVTRCCAPRSLS